MSAVTESVPGAARQLRVSPRECRLVVDRLLLLQGLALGAVPPTRDWVLACELAGLGALGELVDDLYAGATTHPGQLAVESKDTDTTTVDCLGQHALLVGPALLDLVRTVGVGREHEVRVRRVRDGRFFRGLAACLRDADPSVELAVEGESCVLTARPATGADEPARVPYEAMPCGLDVDEDLWWRLFRRSNLVLSPDDPASRRHAGATLVDEAGRVFGDTDEVIDKDLYQGRTSPGFDETQA